ncbi:MAG: MarR family transcriptional regulator [Spirochaetales bacterium]|nr:MarR family transcriptional regulator [Spirochaetales bacterium]
MKQGRYGTEHDENLKLVIALTRSIQRIRRSETAHLHKHGLTPAQFGVLEALFHKGDLKVSEIIDKTLSTGGNITVVIRNLEREGMIHRYQDAADKRSSIIRITNKGTKLIADLWPMHLKDLDSLFANLDLGEKQTLRSLLKKMNGIT